MIRRDFTFQLDEQMIFSYTGGAIEKRLRDPANRSILDSVHAYFEELVDPLVVWQRFPIKALIHDKVILKSGHKIGNGPLGEVVSGAHELVLAVCTVGPGLEQKSRTLMQGEEFLEGIILDGVASWAVDDLRCRFYAGMMDQLQEDSGYRCSTYLSPGESEWSMNDQRIIFDLLDTEIPPDSVSLTESNVMVPFKSLSMGFGIGPDPMGSEGESNCDRCTMRDVCRYRVLRAV